MSLGSGSWPTLDRIHEGVERWIGSIWGVVHRGTVLGLLRVWRAPFGFACQSPPAVPSRKTHVP